MAQIIPIYIPTYISDAAYKPNRVLPRLFFYNGQVEAEEWYVADGNNVAQKQTKFPYFDNYSVITGSFPTVDSKSLLFNNEAPVYGDLPSASLFTEYWDTYVSLLYNPTTRLINCAAIIPLADYFKMELNDIVEWRGNYYQLRAINDYNLSNGECKLQLLGPILPDILPGILPAIASTTTTTTSTTTTTTTAAPCAGCREYTLTVTGSGALDFNWIDCDGNIMIIGGLVSGESVAVCSQTSGSYPYYEGPATGILSSCQATCSCECYDYTQSYATGNYSYYPCSQAIGIGAPIYGQFTGVDAGILTCISSGSATLGITPLAPNTGSGGCTGCANTTTTTSTTTTTTSTTSTTTTTAAPTTTTTTLACVCKQGTINGNDPYFYTDCNGVYQNGSGGDGNIFCFDINQLYSGNISIIGDDPGCTCATTTTTTSTTSTTTTSTTTTTTTTAAPTTTTTTAAPVDIFIDNNNSLDIPITGMTINGVAVTYSSGTDFTINAGNNGNFTSNELGTYTVVISYGSHISGQKITFEDSNNNITCKDLNGSAGSFTIANSVITGGTTIYVTGADGAC